MPSTGLDVQERRALKKLNENRQGSLLDFIEDFTRASEVRGRVRDAAHRQPHLEAENGQYRVVSPERALALGFTGPMLRGSGVEWDLRRSSPTRSTTKSLRHPVGVNGDCYDRYLVRVEEMRQSNRIVKQCIEWLRKNPDP